MTVRPKSRIGELLFGIVALQKGYLTLPQMLSAIADRGAKGLADTLITRGLLDPKRRDEVQAQVEAAVAAAGGDEQATLQNLHTDEHMLLESISGIVVDTDVSTLKSKDRLLPIPLGLAPVFAETPGRYDWNETEELGRGGVGRVVRIWDTSMGRDVAVKQLIHPVETEKQRQALEARFLREARLTGQLEHPAVLPIYEVGRQTDGGLYYAMQRVRGRTLYDAIHATAGLRDRLKLLPHFLTACQAMAYAHSRGVVHRDLKPQNIMTGNYGETYLLDWGLARVRGHTDFQARERAMVPDLTGNVLEGRAIGTPAYMSPEQADGRFADIDERSDVWGLGAVLFELIAQQPPFTGANPIDLLAKVRQDQVVPLQSLRADAPPELCAIAMKCLSRERQDRYPNAGAVAADVEAWLDDRRVSAHHYGALALVRRFLRLNRLAALVAGIAVVALAIGGTLAFQRIQEERDAAKELSQLFLEEVSQKLEPMSGSRALLEELTTKTLPRYEERLDPFVGTREERLKLGWSWQRIGRLTYRIGKRDEADRAFEYASRVADGLVAETPKEPNALTLAAEARVGLADVAFDRGDVKRSEELLREGLAKSELALVQEPNLVLGVETQSRLWSRLAQLLMETDRPTDGLAALAVSRALDKRLLSLKPSDPKVLMATGIGAIQTGQLYLARADHQHARESFEEALDIGEGGLKKYPSSRELRMVYAYAATEANLLDRLTDHPAHPPLQRARALTDEVLTENPDNLEYLSQSVELTAEQPDYAATWRLSEHLIALDASGDYLPSALLGAFVTGHHDEVVRVSLPATGVGRFAGSVYGAMSAALLGDWEHAALLARRAKEDVGQKSTLTWSWRRMDRGIANAPEPQASAVRKLCTVIDTFFETQDPKPLLEALEELAKLADAQAKGR